MIATLAVLAFAACDFVVDTEGDSAAGDCTTSSGTCTLRKAISDVNADATGDLCHITFATTVHTITLSIAEGAEAIEGTDNSVGDLDLVRDEVHISGRDSDPVVIEQTVMSRVFQVATSADNILLRSLVLRGGLMPGGGGGGLHARGTLRLQIEKSHISGNAAQFGGGLAFEGYARVRLSEVVVDDNTATARAGGMLLANADGGGGLPLQDVIERSLFRHNESPHGGALVVDAITLGSPPACGDRDSYAISNSTFFDNASDACASAICVDHSSNGVCLDVQINHATIVGNRTTAALSVLNVNATDTTRLHVFNSIVAQNEVSDCSYLGPASPSDLAVFADFNAVGTSTCPGDLAAARPNDVDDTALALLPITARGVVPFAPGSSAKDKATTATVTVLGPSAGDDPVLAFLPVDQRGLVRPVGAVADIGAAEYSVEIGATIVFEPASPTRGEPFTATVTLTNGGDFPSGPVTVSITLPAGTGTILTAQSGVTCDTQTLPLFCTVDGVPAGAMRTFDVEITAATSGSFAGAVNAIADGDASSSNNMQSFDATVVDPPPPPEMMTPAPTGATGPTDGTDPGEGDGQNDGVDMNDVGDLAPMFRRDGCGCRGASDELLGTSLLALAVLFLRRRRA